MILLGDALAKLKEINTDSIDLIVTDPPYGYSFMNKDWDKAVVGVDTWKECIRVLKPGAFAFIMSSPRQDVFCKMMLNLIEAGFRTDFSSIYWAYASGFPKAADISKLVDKRGGNNMSAFSRIIKNKRLELGLTMTQLGVYFKTSEERINHGGCVSNWEEGKNTPTVEQYNKLVDILKLNKEQYPELQEAEREIISREKCGLNAMMGGLQDKITTDGSYDITKPATEQAKQLEGAYAGFQPKPAVELILTVMKPLSQKSYVDQALDNQKGITWLDDCRIPYQSEQDKDTLNNAKSLNDKPRLKPIDGWNQNNMIRHFQEPNDKGRFPANLLVEDDVLNDGRNYKTGDIKPYIHKTDSLYEHGSRKKDTIDNTLRSGDSGSFSRYFSLDAWSKTYPFLIVPKASKSEKNKGLDLEDEYGYRQNGFSDKLSNRKLAAANNHPTVKPLKLMSYLIIMGSREGDTVLDPFCGSGTTIIAAYQLHRKFIGIEINEEYCNIARKRLEPYLRQSRL